MIQKVNPTMKFTPPLIYRLYELTDHMPPDYARSRPTYASLFYSIKLNIQLLVMEIQVDGYKVFSFPNNS